MREGSLYIIGEGLQNFRPILGAEQGGIFRTCCGIEPRCMLSNSKVSLNFILKKNQK
jgi:hypothetical protein